MDESAPTLTVEDFSLPTKPSLDPVNGYGLLRVRRKGRWLQELILSRLRCPECRLWLPVGLSVAYVASFPHAWVDEIGEHLLEVHRWSPERLTAAKCAERRRREGNRSPARRVGAVGGADEEQSHSPCGY